jgi:hypothetical protein
VTIRQCSDLKRRDASRGAPSRSSARGHALTRNDETRLVQMLQNRGVNMVNAKTCRLDRRNQVPNRHS